MVNVFLGVICAIILFVTLKTIKYNKKRNEGNNKRGTKAISKTRVKIRNNSKISKGKVQSKSKSISPKKKTKTYQSINELVVADPTVLDQIHKDFGIERKKKTNKSKVKKNARKNKKKV